MTRLTAVESDEVERDYVAHRGTVLAMLRADFRRLPDHEEIYQEAWTETLEIRARGETVANTAGLLRTIAWRRARDRARKSVPYSLDPSSSIFESQHDDSSPPEEQAQLRLDAAAIRQIIDSLDPRHAAVLKLRFDHHLDATEIQRRLGVSPKRLEKLVTEAYKRVQAQLGSDASSGDSPWARRQRSLLLVCEMGMASTEQRARAQKMVDEDPICRAMLREMRTTLEGVAAVLPAPVVARQRGIDVSVLLDRLGDLKDHAFALVTRTGGPSAPIEQATAGGLAGIGGGVAAKVAVACMMVGGGAVACTETGVLGGPQPERRTVSKIAKERVRAATIAVKIASPVVRATASVVPRKRTSPRPARTTASASSASSATTPPAVNGPAAPSPAPAGSTEFGPGTAGSASSPPVPSQAPVQGAGEFTP
jgi:RNA polymerase sigma factor (sigma-70 family)